MANRSGPARSPSSIEAHARSAQWKEPRRIFVNSMSDLFHENVSNETIAKVFAVMALLAERPHVSGADEATRSDAAAPLS
jgi:protein gp37